MGDALWGTLCPLYRAEACKNPCLHEQNPGLAWPGLAYPPGPGRTVSHKPRESLWGFIPVQAGWALLGPSEGAIVYRNSILRGYRTQEDSYRAGTNCPPGIPVLNVQGLEGSINKTSFQPEALQGPGPAIY